MEQSGTTDPGYLVTLVHGTFAKGAAWTLDSSDICNALRERLGDRIMLRRFDWSARNTHSARLQAGAELAAVLDADARDNPELRKVLVTHSHGGNVALYACKQAKSQSINDIVFLATPFIRCRERPKMSTLGHFGLFLFSLILSVPLGLLAGAGARYAVSKFVGDGGAVDAHEKLVAQFATFGAFLLSAVVVYYLFRTYLKRRAKAWITTLVWPELRDTRTLSVYYRTDEARSYLTFLNMGTTQLSRLIWQSLSALILVFIAYFLATKFVQAYYPDIYRSKVFSTPNMWWGEGPGPQRGAWYELIGLFLFLYIPIASLVAYALPILRGHPLGYGWELPSTTMMLDIDVLNEPEGLTTAVSDRYGIDIGDVEHGGLVHSFVYEDQRILTKIADWIATGPTDKQTQLATAHSASN